jgi:hypothetical protein
MGNAPQRQAVASRIGAEAAKTGKPFPCVATDAATATIIPRCCGEL